MISLDFTVEGLAILVVCIYAAWKDRNIETYVRMEYEESKALNAKLDKVYKSKKKKNALVKALINAPANEAVKP